MEASELRIGNLIEMPCFPEFGKGNSDGPFYAIKKVRPSTIAEAYTYKFEWVGKPIDLTEEWLYRLGLTKEVKEMLGIWNNGDAIYFSYGFERDLKINHVHQLQNLYFALTGDELKLNDNGTN